MKPLWCWRCQQVVPMLDEDEFVLISRLFDDGLSGAKQDRRELGVPVDDPSLHARFEPVRREYERLTGFANCHQNAVMHHRLSLYGPPCAACGKPLRTPRAKHCAACGVER